MRMVFAAAAAALAVCLSLTGPALAQGLPSDVEDKLGLRKNASRAEVERALSDYQRSGRRLPPETEQKLRVWMSRAGFRRRQSARVWWVWGAWQPWPTVRLRRTPAPIRGAR